MKWVQVNNLVLIHFYRLLLITLCTAIICTVLHQIRLAKKQRIQDIAAYNAKLNGSSSRHAILTNNDIIVHIDKQLDVESFRVQKRIKRHIKLINLSQTIHNLAMGPINPRTNVVVIQVHSNIIYFKQLLKSMKEANGIRNSLLIFSHDYYDEEINKLVRTINFARYMQIFYPYSLQLYPNVYPGEDSILCSVARSVCKNSTLRNAKASQAKLHWWWMFNQVFDNMAIISNYHRDILFLEEGNYVSPDFLYAFRSIQDAKRLHCPFCEFISLAAHKRLGSYQYRRKQNLVLVQFWTDDMPKTALAFDKEIWKAIKAWSKDFCYYNDARWDRSLKNLKNRKWNKNMYVIAIKGPRVFNLGECDEAFGCKTVFELNKFIKEISQELFPRGIVIGLRKEEIEMDDTKPSGDFLDSRDQELCMHFTKRSLWY